MDSQVTCTECFPVDSSIPYGFILTFSPICFKEERTLLMCFRIIQSSNHYRHVIIYSVAGKNFSLMYMYLLYNNKKKSYLVSF